MGHEVRLMPPNYVMPYVKRGKTDAIDAGAICEAVTRPNMRFVPVKTEDQQAMLLAHRARDFLVRQLTQVTIAPQVRFQRNAIRAVAGLTRPHRGHGPRSAGRVWHRGPEGHSQR